MQICNSLWQCQCGSSGCGSARIQNVYQTTTSRAPPRHIPTALPKPIALFALKTRPLAPTVRIPWGVLNAHPKVIDELPNLKRWGSGKPLIHIGVEPRLQSVLDERKQGHVGGIAHVEAWLPRAYHLFRAATTPSFGEGVTGNIHRWCSDPYFTHEWSTWEGQDNNNNDTHPLFCHGCSNKVFPG
jgi:hypothetical protein